MCYNCDFSQALSDDVALHKVDVDDICGMARTLAAVSSTSIGMVKAEASQLTGRFQALVSSVQVTSANATFAALIISLATNNTENFELGRKFQF